MRAALVARVVRRSCSGDTRKSIQMTGLRMRIRFALRSTGVPANIVLHLDMKNANAPPMTGVRMRIRLARHHARRIQAADHDQALTQ